MTILRLIKNVSTYAQAIALATGTKRLEINVTADSDTTKNGKYLYDGDIGILIQMVDKSYVDSTKGVGNGDPINTLTEVPSTPVTNIIRRANAGSGIYVNFKRIKTGTITTTTGSAAIVGVGTKFLTELAAGMLVYYNTTLLGTILSVTDDTHATLSANTSTVVSGVVYNGAILVLSTDYKVDFIYSTTTGFWYKNATDTSGIVTNITVVGKNKVNPSTIMPGYISSTANAGYNPLAGWGTVIVPVTAGNLYAISGWNSAQSGFAFYKGTIPAVGSAPVQANIIRSGNASALGITKSSGFATFTADALSTYVAFTIKSSGEAVSVYTILQVEDNAYTFYEAYSAATYAENIGGNKVKAEYLSPTATINGSVVASKADIPVIPIITHLITVVKFGTLVYIRTSLNSTYDLVQKINLTSSNNCFDFVMAFQILKSVGSNVANFEAATKINDIGDDTAPINTESEGHIMEGHGLNCNLVPMTSHGKTSSDLLSKWTDGAHNFFLIKIIDANNLLFYPEPASTVYGLHVLENLVANLTHVSGAVNTATITTTGWSFSQQYPVTFNNVNKLYIDGVDTTADGTYNCDAVRFFIQYDVSDQSVLTIQTPFTFNTAPSFLQMTVVYNYDDSGGCYMTLQANFKRSKRINYWYALQAAKPISAYPRSYLYLPKVASVGGVDYRTIVENTTPGAQIDYTSANVEDPNNPPNRMEYFFADSGGVKKVGFAMGFSNEKGVTKNSIRKDLGAYWQVASTGKNYPRVIFNYDATNQIITVYGYRTFFDLTEKTYGATSAYKWKEGNVTYMAIDYHTAVDKDVIPISSSLVGTAITVVEKSSTITLLTGDVVGSNQLMITSTGYGYIVVKFT